MERMPDLKELFRDYKGQKIALYGLGTETQKALAELDDFFDIIGLLDGFTDSGILYEKRILPLSQAVSEGIKLIIAVARPGSCKAIARRIGDVCRREGIILRDIRGRNLLESKKVTYGFSRLEGRTKEELYRKIERADVVSFDLFDTLIMREVLHYTDVFALVNEELRRRGIEFHEFGARRLAAEKELSKFRAPILEAIYEMVSGGTENIPLSPRQLAELEWEIDSDTVIPRQAMCEVFEYCIRQGKAVYIVTDTYYRIGKIEEILNKCCLTGYKGILVSCEYGRGKMQGLFECLKDIEGGKKYLHIGDDIVSDMETARNIGMDTYHIFSGEELLDAAGYMGMDTCINNLSDRVRIGMMAARVFNDPFQFEEEDRKIELGSARDIGYLICAPVITDFVLWFSEKVRQEKISNVWFCARDGYLIRKLYEMLDDSQSVYFMTSRTAAVRAGVENEKDIAYVDSMKFSGTVEENLRVRFGLQPERIQTTDGHEQGLMRYKEAILSSAKIQRKRYRTYIEELQIGDGPIAFFDFVAKGTTQMYIQKLLENHLKGLYFLQPEPDFMSDKGVDIESFYGRDETEESAVFDNYYILETILTAPHPSVCGFDDAGKPVFDKDMRKERDLECFLEAQKGILDYFRRYLELVPITARKQNKKLDEIMLGLIHKLKITDRNFLALVVEDPFFNRMTDIADLI